MERMERRVGILLGLRRCTFQVTMGRITDPAAIMELATITDQAAIGDKCREGRM
jgi:hypothetical protein